MRKVPAMAYSLCFVLIILLGLGYLADKDSRVAAESAGASQQGAERAPENVQTDPEMPDPNGSTQNSELVNVAPPSNETGSSQAAETGYFIDVSVGEQKVRIYENQQLIKEWITSTGANQSTPLGRFSIQNRGTWFFSEKYQQGAKWWVSFKDWGVYLFHSVPMDRGQNILTEEADKLGQPASHGCVRLTVENAKWIYDHIPQGTEVYIHQ